MGDFSIFAVFVTALHHPYTAALMRAVPVPDPCAASTGAILKGEVPSPAAPPSGCYFHPRCRFAEDRCRGERRLCCAK
jgi:oligopeptide/dipeptide ABC transporter ATP-binding protein